MLLGLELAEAADDAWEMIQTILALGAREKHKIGEAARLGIAWNFAHESAGGTPWAPLAPMTVGIRRKLGFAGEHPILQRTRELKTSLVDESHPLNIYIEQEPQEGDLHMEFGTADPRFPLLHKGGYIGGTLVSIVPGGMPVGIAGTGRYVPARPMTVLGEQAIARLQDTIIYVLRERWRRLPDSGL